MVVLSSGENSKDKKPCLVVIIGLGFVGAAIKEAFIQDGFRTVFSLRISWQAILSGAFKLDSNLTEITESRFSKIDWVWCAGRAGFTATKEEIDIEFQTFHIWMKFIQEQSENLTDYENRVRVHMLSSAGGLFENQIVNDPDNAPAPMRHYGELKLKQENYIRDLFPRNHRIYRPSSIYGYYNPRKRNGFIPTLISNTVRHRVTHVQGNSDTLRDYIWINDVAAFIKDEIVSNDGSKHPVSFLISGKPSTISEIVAVVKRVTNQHVLLSYSATKLNSWPICFSNALKPKSLNTVDLYTGINNIYQFSL